MFHVLSGGLLVALAGDMLVVGLRGWESHGITLPDGGGKGNGAKGMGERVMGFGTSSPSLLGSSFGDG